MFSYGFIVDTTYSSSGKRSKTINPNLDVPCFQSVLLILSAVGRIHSVI